MELKDMINRRKSFRKYLDRPVEEPLLVKIRQFMEHLQPLYPQIPVVGRIVDKSQVRSLMPWKTQQLVAIYSGTQEGYLENVGFMFQQLDLYLQSLGLGACWLGLGKMRQEEAYEGMEFVILLAFGYPAEPEYRKDTADFNRHSLQQISDREDPKLEPARLAPSSTNSQPWFFTHEGDGIHAYCSQTGFLRHKALGYMNRIDMGIALAHLYAANPDTFRFYLEEKPEVRKGYQYIGSVVL